MTASPRRRLSPELPLRFTMSRMLSWSIAFTTFSYCSGEIGVGWWLWMSITGNLARGTGCCGTTSVERGLYSRIFGGGHSGWRPSAGRGRIWPGVCAVWAWIEIPSAKQSTTSPNLRFITRLAENDFSLLTLPDGLRYQQQNPSTSAAGSDD